ncbi:MAG: glycosyltransferase [Desulfotignum sp.]|nr:glycosyltransferase [Desulfotignum sp.]
MKKRVAYVVHSLNLGGTERLAADMALALQKEYDIRIICLDEPGIWADPIRAAGIPVLSFYRQPGLDLRLPVMLARYAARNLIHFFHAHQCTPWFYTGLSRLLYPRPKLLFEEHGRLYPEVLNKKRRAFNRMVLQRLTHTVTAVSHDVKNRLFLYEGLDPDKTYVVYNGTRPLPAMAPDERRALRARFGFTQKDVVAGFIGRLDPIKNLCVVLDGFQTALAGCPDLKLLIIGDGPLFTEIKEKIIHMSLSDHVVLAGYQKDAAALAPVLDVFVLASLSEGTSMALLEAMSAGVPAIVSNAGGNPEIVVNNQTGWVVPTGDGSALSRALTEAALDKRKSQAMGNQANKRFLENFTFDQMIHTYKTLYQQL